jgi:excisionase family DNA binding protein
VSTALTAQSKATIAPRLLRIPQAAQYIGGTNWFVEELCRNKRIAFLTVGKYRVIDVRELDRWIEAQQCGVSNAS